MEEPVDEIISEQAAMNWHDNSIDECDLIVRKMEIIKTGPQRSPQNSTDFWSNRIVAKAGAHAGT